ncbi:hypothetical protein AB2L28_13935 [Kineococcus sp. TBRC 1896]|uniref:Secreted protein with PEP-CTERM sorting signal n=1 Tax=Kineococcus mangrovi TaxID=1660183 RepID=A0ABV4I3U6_9ACTN
MFRNLVDHPFTLVVAFLVVAVVAVVVVVLLVRRGRRPPQDRDLRGPGR